MFKIIIVEDDKEIREELKILLENSGYEVQIISDFEHIIEKIIEEQVHLILLDINLPNKDGFEICSKIRAKSKVPIIFVTSRNNSMDELKGIMLGGDDYIEKPYNVPILLARIKNLLNRTYLEERESKIEYKGITLEVLKSKITYNKKEIEAVLQPPQALSRRDSRIKWKFDAAVPFLPKIPLSPKPPRQRHQSCPHSGPQALAAKRLRFSPQRKSPYPANEPPAAKARTLVSGSTNPSCQHIPAAWRHQ